MIRKSNQIFFSVEILIKSLFSADVRQYCSFINSSIIFDSDFNPFFWSKSRKKLAVAVAAKKDRKRAVSAPGDPRAPPRSARKPSPTPYNALAHPRGACGGSIEPIKERIRFNCCGQTKPLSVKQGNSCFRNGPDACVSACRTMLKSQ